MKIKILLATVLILELVSFTDATVKSLDKAKLDQFFGRLAE